MSDEERLEALRPDERHPGIFIRATSDLVAAFGLEVRLLQPGEPTPTLAADQRRSLKYGFEYSGAVEDLMGGADIRLAVVTKGDRVVGFGLAEIMNDSDAWEVRIINVDEHWRRKSGVELPVVIAGQHFSVGIAHVIVNALLPSLPRPVFADATSPGSRYAFKAFGFVHRGDTSNPCLVVLR